MRRTHRLRLTLAACVLLAGVLRASASEAEPSKKSGNRIPSDLQLLMKGWEANLGQVRTLQANGRLRIENKMFAACKDLDEKSYSDQRACFKIWRDGENHRVDIVYDRTFDPIKKRVNYNLPLGEYRWRAGDAMEKERLQREHGTTQTTTRIMQVGPKLHHYLVESRDYIIDKADEHHYLGPEPCRWMWKGSVLVSETFSEYITDLSERSTTKSIDVVSLSDGRCAVRQTFVGTDQSGEVTGSTRIIIDTNKGYTVESFTREAGGRTVYDANFRYRMADKAWVLVSAVFKSYDWMGKKPDAVTNAVWLDVDDDSLKVNEAIASCVFTVESLRVHDDALVRDAVEDKRYRYGDRPR